MRIPAIFTRSRLATLLSQLPIWTGTMIMVQAIAHGASAHAISWPLTFSWGSVMSLAYTWRPRMRWSQ